MQNNATIRNMVIGYVMKDYYVGAIDVTNANFDRYTINNHRQLAIAEMYSWATYTLGRDIVIPYTYGSGAHAGEFAYSNAPIGDNNGARKIYSFVQDGYFMGIEEVVK